MLLSLPERRAWRDSGGRLVGLLGVNYERPGGPVSAEAFRPPPILTAVRDLFGRTTNRSSASRSNRRAPAEY